MDPEQRFLQSRQARLVAASSSVARNEELSIFWSELRRLLKEWNGRLLEYQHQHQTTEENTNVSNNNDNDPADLRDGGSLFRQELQDLKEELQGLRQHCLHAAAAAASSSNSNTTPTNFYDWSVPTELPNADLRLLHAEFTRCSTSWESVYQELFPKGKFIFRRYREELARRKALGIPLEAAVTAATSIARSRTQNEKDTNNVLDDSGSVQNISDSMIHIQDDGTVQIRGRDDTTNEDRPSSSSERATIIPQRITAAAVLLRNVQNCTIQIDKALESMHLVDTAHVTIVVSQSIASSIHITNCQQCELTARSQQLRIHESTELRFHVQLVAGAILEESKDIVFVGGNDLDVKDFNWLRTGVPSPNFRIEPLSETNATGDATEMKLGDEEVVVVPNPTDSISVEKNPSAAPVENNAGGGHVDLSSPKELDSDEDDEL